MTDGGCVSDGPVSGVTASSHVTPVTSPYSVNLSLCDSVFMAEGYFHTALAGVILDNSV